MFKSISAAVFVTAFAAPAFATVIDFNDYSGGGSVANSTYEEDGFLFTFGNNAFIFEGSSTNSNFNGFSSIVLELDRSSASLTKVGGGLFDFTSVLVSQSSPSVPITFTGIFADTSTIVSSIIASRAGFVDASVQTFAGFTGIQELVISSVGNEFALYDDFTLDAATSPVPLPASLPLALLGVGALWGLQRRRG